MSGFFVEVTGRPIVLMSGREGLDLLQRISTNDLSPLKSGGKVQTILTNDKGRIVDVVSAFPRGVDNILLVGSNPSRSVLKGWIEKFVIMEDIIVSDVTSDFYQLILFRLEPNSEDSQLYVGGDFLYEKWGATTLLKLVGEAVSHDSAVRKLSDRGIGTELPGLFEQYRISEGIPVFPYELSTSYNPLEAGLESMVSWTKGCYVGQEVIARLDTYHKVQRRLVRLRLDRHPGELPTAIRCGTNEAGVLTSASNKSDDEGVIGLGYIRTGFLGAANELSIRDGTTTIGAKAL